MLYGEIPGVSRPVARLVQGTMMLGSQTREEDFALLDAVAAEGGNVFDTAHVYGGGRCEEVLGQWMAERRNREDLVILGKGAHPARGKKRVTPEAIQADLADSLDRLGTDYIDIYMLHRDDPDVPVGPIVDCLHALKEAGRIHAYGGSNWTHQRIAEANAHAAETGKQPFTASSPHFSLAEQYAPPWEGCVSITGAANADARAWYRASGMALMGWSTLSGGFFSGCIGPANVHDFQDSMVVRCYGGNENWERLARAEALAAERGYATPQIAVAWVTNQAYDAFPLVAAHAPAEFAENAAALNIELSPEEIAWLNLEGDRPTQ